ncbi:DciA family protein [Streptomyces tendae]|uniref:DciA family protein n=1 Tax=Streptomyces tendae TaxID=1932 RepID=UPI003EBFA80D
MSTQDTAVGGADLARIALRQAKESARRRGATAVKPKRSVRKARGDSRDPLALGAVMQRLLVDNGWQEAAEGRGTLITQWPAIVGAERAEHWKAVRFDEATKTLTVVCESDSWARMLSLVSRNLINDANEAVPGAGLRAIQVRKGVHRGGRPAEEPAPRSPSPAPPTPQRPRSDAPSPSYAGVRDQMRSAKADRDAAVDAPSPRRIQERPENHVPARAYQEELEAQAARSADVHRRALLRARQERSRQRTAQSADRAAGAV